LTPLKTARYPKHTCTLARIHIIASYVNPKTSPEITT
jgi:hypothetical protein